MSSYQGMAYGTAVAGLGFQMLKLALFFPPLVVPGVSLVVIGALLWIGSAPSWP